MVVLPGVQRCSTPSESSSSLRILSREDPEASALLAQVFEREGARVLLEARPLQVATRNGTKLVTVQTGDGELTVDEADEILIGAGRQPNLEGLALERAGVSYDPRTGVEVDDFLRTSSPDIVVAGDVCMNWKLTHAADAAARIAVQDALFLGRKRLSALTMPWCTCTDPEIAHVGLYEADARARGIPTEVFETKLDRVDRAVAMAGKIGLKSLADDIHPYPTQAEAIRRVVAAYNRTRMTPLVASAFK